MTGLIEHILDVSASLLLAVLVAVLIVDAALFQSRPRGPDRLGWLAPRFRTGAPTGLALTHAVLALAVCAWSLAWLTFSVVHHLGLAQADPGPGLFHRSPRALAHQPGQGAHLARLDPGALAGRHHRRPGPVAPVA